MSQAAQVPDQVRHATPDDLAQMMAMYDHSRALMRQMGNTTQWVNYPTEQHVGDDIARGQAYIVEQNGRAVGCFALVEGQEPTYAHIEHGRWIDPVRPYATLHRMACAPEVHGVAAQAFAFAKAKHNYLRCDTHRTNGAMLHVMEREHFVHSGVVYMTDRTDREAFEWWRWDEVSVPLREYIDQHILPRYQTFDAAHQMGHALRVIARTMLTGMPLGLAPDMLYAVAAMHDVGLDVGRERHHLEGGRRVREDVFLRSHFSTTEVEQMAQAVEDHRASSTQAPRSLLGAVLAEADRDVEPEEIVRRTVEYGQAHYPALGRAEQWERALRHLHEKYGREGYLRLWLNPSPNEEPLEELRCLIEDERRLKAMFDRYYIDR